MSGFLDYFKGSRKSSAAVAKERLQIIVAHERGVLKGPEYLPMLQQELLMVVRKYVPISDEHIKISMDKDGEYEVLELNISLPDLSTKSTHLKR
jgi:cell division topological specificity factor